MIPVPIPRVDTEKKPDHVGEGLLQGLNKWADHVGDGAQKLWRKPQEGAQKEGALGAAKGVGEGLLNLATGVGKGTCDLLGSTLEGVRHTPDAVADKVVTDRKHNKHGVEGDGQGELLQTFVEEEKEPEHLGEGLLAGVRGLGRGLTGGLTDLATKPMEGAKEGGAKGFALGAGKGLLGFGTKLSSGTLDFATSVLSGAKNTPDAIEKKVAELRGSPTAAAEGAASSARGSSSGSFLMQGDSATPLPAFSGQGNVLGSSSQAAGGAAAAPAAARAPQ